jgi:mannose-1-phosphate guanylyltransferase / mannose-6-phosphate isomerase
VMVVLPSDHILQTGPAWRECLESAIGLATAGYLVTIGITPTRPETAYGYIKAGEALPEYAVGDALPHRADRFVEKPDAERAAAFLAEGGYSWNAGIFVLGVARVLDEMEAFEDTAEIARTARWLAGAQAAGEVDADEARGRFGALPSISIDYAVMERSEHVAVVPSMLSWSDVGSLEALGDVSEPDGSGNVRVGRGVDIDTRNSIIYGVDRLVATLGVEDLMVIDTADATLVARKDRAQDVRFVVDALKAAGAEEVVKPKVSLRPWGSWTSLLAGPGFQIKLLELKPGGRPSLQRHHHRSEHWIVVAGTALVTRDGERIEVHVNESAYIPVGSEHRIENCGKVPLKVIEVQVGEYLGEDDIIRIEDDWNREG